MVAGNLLNDYGNVVTNISPKPSVERREWVGIKQMAYDVREGPLVSRK